MSGEISNANLKKLEYEISKYSSYSTSYLPENIREDNPNNQTSRWSSNSNNPPQYLILKLQKPAIVKKIKFGKFEKTHVCNLRKFKVFGGLEEEHMVLLFEGGLKNDSVPESFELRHKTNTGELIPVRFIQIMPLLSWGPSFNFSIWYVELIGVDESMFLALRNYNILREMEIVRLCLKHCRQQGYERAFEALQNETKVQLEHPMMTELHDVLVVKGDFNKTEEMMKQYLNDGLMDNYISQQMYKADWTLLKSDDEKSPGKRGGHQLIYDSTAGCIYLYGGWDGSEDLSDLWSYDIKSSQWQLIHEKSEAIDGPSPRACHKMVYDSSNSQIFMLGRYLDGASRTKEFLKSDFYLYNTLCRSWFLICDDTSQVGGPPLVYDHQMCIDTRNRTIYVLGGRIVTPKNQEDVNSDFQYSGLYSYHISTNTWTHIMVDSSHISAADPGILSIKARVNHAMLFHHKHKKLYVFGGQRGKEYMVDIQTIDIATHEIANVTFDTSSLDPKGVPQTGFTQRATIDCEKDEIYVLTSLSKEKERRDSHINSFWVYSLKTKEWSCIYKSDYTGSDKCYAKKSSNFLEPCPRYAHQLVYDYANKVHYLFGGNPGKNSPLRLNDFWSLQLKKPSRNYILRQCQYLIRRQEYEEIAKKNPIQGVSYLQTKLCEIIDHENSVQLNEFHKLASLLFKSDDIVTDNDNSMTCSLGIFSNANKSNEDSNTSSGNYSDNGCSNSSSSSAAPNPVDEQFFYLKLRRNNVFNKLIELMPDNYCQPKGNLSDFVLI